MAYLDKPNQFSAGSIAVVMGPAIAGYFLGAGVVFIVVPIIAGSALASWYAQSSNANKTLIEVISWSNLVTWLIPILGFATGGATAAFAEKSEETSPKRMVLGALGIVASLGNLAAAVWLRTHPNL